MATMERARRGRRDERDGHGDRDGGGRREDTKAAKRVWMRSDGVQNGKKYILKKAETELYLKK